MKKPSPKLALNNVNTISTAVEWAVIIVLLILMASLWNAMLNFGQSNPGFSTILVMIIAGLGWWFLVVNGPKVEAQTQRQLQPLA